MDSEIKNSKILIVDDQDSNITLLEHLLSLKGYTQIKYTDDSRQVERLVDEFCPDIVLLDLMMPHFSGFEVMELLQSKGKLNGFMPILVLTADANMETRQRALQNGASDFLTKPFDLLEVDLRIHNLLQTVFLLKQLQHQNQILEEKVKERTLELTNINEAIVSQNERLREIAWTQSHIVRAPLARLLGVVNLLQAKVFSDELPEEKTVQIIIDSANELDEIIKSISMKAHNSKLFDIPSE